MIVSSLLVPIMAELHHDRTYFCFLLAMGLTAGWLAKKTKGLAMPIWLHAANNAIFVLSVAGA